MPHLLRYQGTLTDANNVPLEGTYNLSFRIYDASTAGNLLWSETQTSVSVSNGVFSVLLGNVTPLNLAFDKDYWLSTEVGTSGEMSPRQRITSVGYAIRAEVSETISDPTFLVPRGGIIMWSGSISNIPAGWALCDGTNGTPDLRDKFIVGAKQDDSGIAKTNITGSLTQSGGSVTLTEANLPAHTHTIISGGAHTHTISTKAITAGWEVAKNAANSAGTEVTSESGIHDHGGVTGMAGSGTPYTQPYYALAYIMKL